MMPEPMNSSHQDTANECFVTHLIDENGVLDEVGFDDFLKKVNLAACELNYAVVSIMGPQSSGKSTLLNHLFGTTLDVMDASAGRFKTTRGIWMARCPGIEPCTLVMDLEGSDGRERGEDASFEKRTGLFALAVSHTVLINMPNNCVGRESGASKPLLEAVFQGVLRLFTPRKTTLMFVIHDLEETPLEKLESILREDILKIWDSIPKPEGHERTALDTYFNVEFVGLPHYVFRKEQYKDQVKVLRQRFSNSIVPGGLAGDRWDTIHGSGFSLSAQKIWQTIKEDKELDLPKHTVMVATVLCEKIADAKLRSFIANEEGCITEEGDQYPATDFGKKLSSKIESCLVEYEEDTAYFVESVRTEKKKYLEEKLVLFVQPAVRSNLERIGSGALEEFKEAFADAIKRGQDILVASHACKDACIKSFEDRCAEVIVKQANCDPSEERKKLQDQIQYHTLKAHLEHRHTRFEMFKYVAMGFSAAAVIVSGIATAAVMPSTSATVARGAAVAIPVVGQFIKDTANECFVTHLIDENGGLDEVGFDDFLKKVNLAACGLNYAVVSIMGPQSSGKSTLLNHLFGTTLDVMDASAGRSKTTKGVWMGRCPGIEPCTLVMDLEGSDGRERGEDASFEKRTGLFALAVSRVVLINMFYNSVGLENGASKPLLKDIFQGVLRLFTPRKTTLMFVLRDLVETATPLETLERTLKKDIQEIWDSIPKPEGHEETSWSEFFNVDFLGLPHYELRNEQFRDKVKILRQQFNNSTAAGGLAGDGRDAIPGSGFSLSVQKIWQTIKEDKELDLPKHIKVIAAILCCEQIAMEKLKAFEERCKIDVGAQYPATGFGRKLSSEIESCLEEYETATADFDESVRSDKKKDLEEKLVRFIQLVERSNLERIASRTLQEFKEAFADAIKRGQDILVASHACEDACIKSFEYRCADVIVGQVNHDPSEERNKLREQIYYHVLEAHLDQRPKTRTRFEEFKYIAMGFSAAAVIVSGIATAAVMPSTSAIVARGAAVAIPVIGQFIKEAVRAYNR